MGYFSGRIRNVTLHLRALMQRLNALPENVQAGYPDLTMKSHDQPGDNGELGPSTLGNERELRLQQLTLIQDAKVGSPDWAGDKITAILAKHDNFLIYHVEGDRDDDSLRVFVANKSDDKEKIMTDNYNKIQLAMTEVYSAIPKSRNPKRTLRKVANVIAMVLGAHPDDKSTFDDATDICKNIAEQINKEYSRVIQGKLFYLIGCLSAGAVLSLASSICFILKQTDFISNNNVLVQLFYAATFASYGGFISVFITLNQLVFETELRNRDYMFYGLTRILVSILGGIFIFIAVKSGLVLNVAASSFFGVFVFCFVAGFREKFMPDLLKKLETRENEKAK